MRNHLYLWIVGLAFCTAVAHPAHAQGGNPTDPSPQPASSAPTEPGVDPPSTTAEPPRTTAEPASIGGAVAVPTPQTEPSSGSDLDRGASGLMDQGTEIWQAVLLPMWQRIAAAIPSLFKAILLLLVFWVAAVLLGAGARRLLMMTELDNRAAQDWGLSGFIEKAGGKNRSLEDLAGLVVKWIVLLFGFVAFFQALDLEMVARPLQNVADAVLGVVPSLLKAAVILLAYWIVANVVKMALTKGLALIKLDERAGKYLAVREEDGKKVGPSATLGRLAFYLILLFGLPPFLHALGQTALVAPLSAMLGKALAFLPNIVAALVLFFVGKLVATIVREVVSNFLAASGIDGRVETLGLGRALGERRLSDVVAAVAYFFILIPVLVAAVDALKITAVSEPVTATLESLLTAVPLLFVALVVLAIGYAVASAVRGVFEAFLVSIGFDDLPEKFGLEFLVPREGRKPLSAVCSLAVMWIIMLLTLEQALASLQLEQLAVMTGALIAYLPNLLAGVAIILVALSLSSYVARLIKAALGDTSQAQISVRITQVAIVFLGISMGLAQLGLGEEIVRIVVGSVLFGAALALGLAFGLGGQVKARELLDRLNQP